MKRTKEEFEYLCFMAGEGFLGTKKFYQSIGDEQMSQALEEEGADNEFELMEKYEKRR